MGCGVLKMGHIVLWLGPCTDTAFAGDVTPCIDIIVPYRRNRLGGNRLNVLWAINMYLAGLENIYEHINFRLLDVKLVVQ